MELIVENNIINYNLIVEPDNNLELLLESQQSIVLELDTVTTGEAINGLPNGGTTGQILAKASNADYDAEWINNDTGSVTSVSVVNDNGFDGTVATPTTTPTITIKTTVTGIVKGDGTAISAATPDVDYATISYVDGKVEDQIVDGITTIAPSQNAVFDALAGKQPVITPAALTKADDTNVTLTLGGTPNTALLEAVSLTLGWAGELSIARGGTNSGTALGAFNNLSPLTTLGDTLYHNGTNNVRLGGNTTTNKQFLSQTGDGINSAAPIWAVVTAGDIGSGEALTKVDDTNVTLSLGGTPATSLLKATSLTLGWTGTLAPSRGGTGVSNTGTITLGGNLVTSGAFDLTLTQTGATNVTLPTTGTLATLAGIETLTNKTIDADLNTITNIENADIKAGAAIDVNKLASITADRIVISNVSGFISAADTATYPNLTELSYVKGVTSSIQTQLDAKQTNVLTNSHILVGDGSNIATDVAMSGDVTIDNTGVTAISAGVIVNTDINAAAAIDATKIANGSVSNTEFQYLDGVTSAIQTQINTKVTKGGDSGATLTIGTLTANDLEIILNNNVRWTFDNANGYLRKGNGSAYFGLQLYGTGAGSVISLGDTFDSTTPYTCLREYGGTDTDQIECYGQKGAGLRAGTWGSTTPQVWITQGGRVGFNQTTPTAKAHFAGSSAGSDNAAIKIDSGTLATAADGNFEYDGTNYYLCVSTTRYQIARVLTGSASLNFPNTNAQLSSDLTITVTGAADGDTVALGVPNAAVNANSCYTAWVSAANTVTVRFNNYSALAINPASGTFKATVFKNI